MKNLLLIKAKKFTIEWYYNNKGKSDALDYYEKLSLGRKKKLAYLLYVIGEIGQIKNKEKFTNEHDQIFAFKPQPDRFLCFFSTGAKLIITNAYEKKSQKCLQKKKNEH